MADYIFQFQKLWKFRLRKLVFVIWVMVYVVLVFQTITLPSRHSLLPLHPFRIPAFEQRKLPGKAATPKSMRVGKFYFVSDSQNSTPKSTDLSIVLKEVETAEVSNMGGETDHGFRIKKIGNPENDNDLDDSIGLYEHGDPNGRFSSDFEKGVILKKVRDPVATSFNLEKVLYPKDNASLEKVGGLGNGSTFLSDGVNKADSMLVFEQIKILDNGSVHHPHIWVPIVSNDPVVTMASIISSSGKNTTETGPLSGNGANKALINNDSLVLKLNDSRGISIAWVKKKIPPVYISDMNSLLLRNRASNQSMRPQWSTESDKQILSAKKQIENASTVKNDQQIYAPLFRNISMFKRSYELMEQILKIYVYKEEKKPIFHQPLLKGIYASEGWFMKLMETNRHFVVKDPRKAHLYYMPFSSRQLQLALYTQELRYRRELEQYLKNYVNMIAAKYPFWNRTGGEDHFLVACHDWAPFETRYTMEHSIRVLCNADLRSGFQLGKDVSLPETNVRSPLNPLKDIGGRPADRRPTLAFFAGNLHGSFRPKLLRYWENKDPDMKIFGPLPGGVKERKTAFIQYMKTSKYCICPKGHEVNSPRVVESIFYECVPVIISNNYVLPFFEVLNWKAFSVILQEKDVPRLKEILESIPEEKYLALQKGVRKVQQHFLWHAKPVKYDLFHMILHSIWFNRMYQIRT